MNLTTCSLIGNANAPAPNRRAEVQNRSVNNQAAPRRNANCNGDRARSGDRQPAQQQKPTVQVSLGEKASNPVQCMQSASGQANRLQGSIPSINASLRSQNINHSVSASGTSQATISSVNSSLTPQKSCTKNTRIIIVKSSSPSKVQANNQLVQYLSVLKPTATVSSVSNVLSTSANSDSSPSISGNRLRTIRPRIVPSATQSLNQSVGSFYLAGPPAATATHSGNQSVGIQYLPVPPAAVNQSPWASFENFAPGKLEAIVISYAII